MMLSVLNIAFLLSLTCSVLIRCLIQFNPFKATINLGDMKIAFDRWLLLTE